MNSFTENLKRSTNYTTTENGALARATTYNAVYDMFGLGGAYRQRSENDCIALFEIALDEDVELAMKCLFYLRDCQGGGQGERRFFRVCYKWLAEEHPEIALRNFKYIPEYGRWDDVFYSLVGTPLEIDALNYIKEVVANDLESDNSSLLGKWLPSENTSSYKTRETAHTIRKHFKMSHKEYRQMLSKLRKKINVLERLMSANEWERIDFSKIPSKAGIKYKDAFLNHEIITEKYKNFAESDSNVNASALYPYEVVGQVLKRGKLSETDRLIIEKYWNNLPNYFENKPCKMMCVVDTSASMVRDSISAPINIAIGLGIYCAERMNGPFKNHYISFSRFPRLVEIKGKDFVDKVLRIYKTNICENTNLVKVFRLLKEVSLTSNPEDIPETIVIISDMEIDMGLGNYSCNKNLVKTEMEKVRQEWEEAGLKMPHLVYWNCECRSRNSFLEDADSNVTYVSGVSPSIFEAIVNGKNGWDLCYEVLTSERYKKIY